MISYVPESRRSITSECFRTLSETDTTGLERPVFSLLFRRCKFKYPTLSPLFNFYQEEFPDRLHTNALIVKATDLLLLRAPDITHIVFLYDDFVFHRQWLRQLAALIERHPKARAWSVYRSSYTRHHRITGGDGTDVTMTMHDGLGCVTVEEWVSYWHTFVKVCGGDATVPGNHELGGGCTLDVHHAYAHAGDRWATSRDYMENLGVHPELGRQDQAIDFVGLCEDKHEEVRMEEDNCLSSLRGRGSEENTLAG